MLSVNCLSQSTSEITIEDSLEVLNRCFDDFDYDQFIAQIESKGGSLCNLTGLLITYSFQDMLELSTVELEAIKRRTAKIAERLFLEGNPSKIFIIGGYSGCVITPYDVKNFLRIHGKTVQPIYYCQTCVRSHLDELKEELIVHFNNSTERLTSER